MENFQHKNLKEALEKLEEVKKRLEEHKNMRHEISNISELVSEKQKIHEQYLDEIYKSYIDTYTRTKEYVDFIRLLFEKIIDICLFLLKICIPLYIGVISLQENAKVEFINTDYAKSFIFDTIVIVTLCLVIVSILGFLFLKKQIKDKLSIGEHLLKSKLENAKLRRDVLRGILEWKNEMATYDDIEKKLKIFEK